MSTYIKNIQVIDVKPKAIAVIDPKPRSSTVLNTKPKDINVFGETQTYNLLIQAGQWTGFTYLTYPTTQNGIVRP